MDRIDWDAYFIEIAKLVAKRSGCLRRQVGSVIVKGKRVLGTGYNSAPYGIKECYERGECIRETSKQGENLDKCFSTHSELNAILQMAKYGISCEDAVLYVTTFPCVHCMKAIINSGIREIVYLEDYNAPLSKELATLSKIKVRQYKG